MYLKQLTDEKIIFGTDEHRHVLALKGPQRFKADDVDVAAADLLAAYPDEAETIERYAERLRKVLT